jgi:glycolate oxidase FAD binding subunit
MISRDEIPGGPPGDTVLAPQDTAEAAAVFGFAAEHGIPVRIWGGGTHAGIGNPVQADVVLWTGRMQQVVDWQAEDLTIVVAAGVEVDSLEQMLAERGQTAVLPEDTPGATVGGIVAAGLSGWRRLRYGPTRDRVLEVTLATGDGRVVRAGGRVVKNVTGYDIPRLATGSLGSLGMIGTVCLKLWPLSPEVATLRVGSPGAARQAAYRPLAVVETRGGSSVYLTGTADEIEAQAARIGGSLSPGLDWPEPPTTPYRLAVRVPPADVSAAVERVAALGWGYQAAHGVGEIRVAAAEITPGQLTDLRGWAEGIGGSVVVMQSPETGRLDPWGTPPGSLELQRRVKQAFDPRAISNRGILPGGL